MQNEAAKFYLKDLLLPVITAAIVVFLNQVFIFNSKNTEAKVDYELNRLKEQVPILNQLLWYSLSNSRAANQDSLQKVEGKHKMEDLVPSFLYDPIQRKRFEEDLDFIKKNRNLMDHKLRILVEHNLYLIEYNRLPALDESGEQFDNSIWADKTVLKEWYDNLDSIYNYAYEMLYREKFDGQYRHLNELPNKIKQVENQVKD